MPGRASGRVVMGPAAAGERSSKARSGRSATDSFGKLTERTLVVVISVIDRDGPLSLREVAGAGPQPPTRAGDAVGPRQPSRAAGGGRRDDGSTSRQPHRRGARTALDGPVLLGTPRSNGPGSSDGRCPHATTSRGPAVAARGDASARPTSWRAHDVPRDVSRPENLGHDVSHDVPRDVSRPDKLRHHVVHDDAARYGSSLRGSLLAATVPIVDAPGVTVEGRPPVSRPGTGGGQPARGCRIGPVVAARIAATWPGLVMAEAVAGRM